MIYRKKNKKGRLLFLLIKDKYAILIRYFVSCFYRNLHEFNWQKSMYWGDNYSLKWVRPIRAIVAILFDSNKRERVPLKVRDISQVSLRSTSSDAPRIFEFTSIDDYNEKILRGKVILQPQDRKKESYKKVQSRLKKEGFF